jgi:hypothetical protein
MLNYGTGKKICESKKNQARGEENKQQFTLIYELEGP